MRQRTALEYGLIENYVRSSLSAYEEALVVRSLMQYYGMSQRQISERLGRAEQHILRLLAVFDLVEEVQKALHEGAITLGHAVEIHALKAFPARQRKILSEVLSQGMSVKAARTRVAVHPAGKGYKVDFSFVTADDFDKIVTFLRNRLNP